MNAAATQAEQEEAENRLAWAAEHAVKPLHEMRDTDQVSTAITRAIRRKAQQAGG